MRLSSVLIAAGANFAAAMPGGAPNYASTVVLTTISYYTHTVVPSSTSSKPVHSAPVYTAPTSSATPVPVYTAPSSKTPKVHSTTCSTLKTVPYYSAPSMKPVPLTPTVYTSAYVAPTVVPSYSTIPPTYTGAANVNAGGYGGALAVAALVAALV